MVLPLSILLLCVIWATIVKKFLKEMGLISIHVTRECSQNQHKILI